MNPAAPGSTESRAVDNGSAPASGSLPIMIATATKQFAEAVEARRADDVDAIRQFAHQDNALGRVAGCGQVNVRELCDRMAERVVKIAGGHVAAVNVGQSAAGRHRRERTGERLDAVAKDHDDVAFRGFEKSRNAGHAAREPLRLVQRAVRAGLHTHPRPDRPAVTHDVSNRVAEVAEQVHSGHDDLKLEPRVRSDFP